MSRRLILVTALMFAALILALVIAHNRLSPGVVVDNQSAQDFDRLVVELPANRVVIAPVPRDRRLARSFTPRGTTGELRYTLYRAGAVAARGRLDYGPEGDVFRLIRFRIDPSGEMTVESLANDSGENQ